VTELRLDPEFISEHQERCRRIVSGAERPYDVALELMWVISEHLSSVPAAVYGIWAELTDVCELQGPAAGARAQELMRQAAAEFLSLVDYELELAGYADRWAERISRDELLKS